MSEASARKMPIALSLILLGLGLILVARPVLGSSPDFALSANPANVIIPEGHWADTMLTLSSLNGLQGTVQLSMSFGTNTPGLGAGFSTGMSLNPGGVVNTDMMLTAGNTPGSYTYVINATVGGVSHTLSLPVTVAPISRPDFITRLWGSWSILQDRNNTIPEQLVSLDGFQGRVDLTVTVAPSIPDSPSLSITPASIQLQSGLTSNYVTTIATTRQTPVGNYIITVSASSGTITHVSKALLMVGDFRPPMEQGPNNSTITLPANGTTMVSPQTSIGNIASSAVSALQSSWPELLLGLVVITAVFMRQKRLV